MRRLATVTMIAALAVGAAACGSSSSNDAGTDTTRAAAAGSSTTAGSGGSGGSDTVPAGTTELRVATSSLGDIVVDGEGRTLYLFTADQGTTSACNDACLAAWPALVAPAEAGSGVTGALGTATQATGDDQVTLNGHLLYYYAADAAPGATSGQGVGGRWFVVDPAGNAITKAPASSSGY